MNRVTKWISALRLQRRANRVELLGGYPGKGPKVTIEEFRPELNQAERIKNILGGVSRLGTESVDEATGYPLDNLINAEGDQWQRIHRRQHLVFRATARRRLIEARSVVEQYQQLREEDLFRLRNAEIAVETALLALSGQEPEYSGGRPAGGSPPPGPPGERRKERRARGGEPDQAWAHRLDGPAALVPPKVNRTELRRLLEPDDAQRVPRWGESGFRDGTLLAGRPRSAYLHAFALVLAAGADLGAFVQVVELVLPQQDWVIWLVVLGLTSVVLYIAHTIGAMLREASARPRTAHGLAGRVSAWLGRRVAPFICTVIWLALGLMAFWVRLTVPLIGTVQLGGGGIGSGGGGGTSVGGSATDTHALQGAAIFLGLYLATGVVAAVGAYFSHNPYRGRYVAAIRAYRKASERAAASSYQAGQAMASYEHQLAEIDTAEQVLAEVLSQDRAFTEQLKQTARLEIASQARDPAVTDAIFEQDHDPYWPGPSGSPTGGDEAGEDNP